MADFPDVLIEAAAYERDRRADSYPALVEARRLGADEATVDYQCWCAIADWFATRQFKTIEGGVDGRTLVDWVLAEDAAEKALAKTAERVAAAERDPDFDAGALAERRRRRANLVCIHRAVHLRRESIEKLNADFRARRHKELAA